MELSHTGLHAQEAGPGIVCAAIAKTGQEAEEQTHQVCIGRVEGLLPSSQEGGLLGLFQGLRRWTGLEIGRGRRWLSGFLHGRISSEDATSPQPRIRGDEEGRGTW